MENFLFFLIWKNFRITFFFIVEQKLYVNEHTQTKTSESTWLFPNPIIRFVYLSLFFFFVKFYYLFYVFFLQQMFQAKKIQTFLFIINWQQQKCNDNKQFFDRQIKYRIVFKRGKTAKMKVCPIVPGFVRNFFSFTLSLYWPQRKTICHRKKNFPFFLVFFIYHFYDR